VRENDIEALILATYAGQAAKVPTGR